MRRRWLLFVLTGLLIAGCQRNADSAFSLSWINLDHLDSLCERGIVEGDSVSIVHIYADYPDYDWVDAGDEGIACVDDATRAIVVYLRHFELTDDSASLEKAKALLAFVMAMQADDGEFYNFINADWTINRTGKTSLKSFDFWAARGYWALALGYRIFLNQDPTYAQILRDRFIKCKGPLNRILERFGSTEAFNGREYPTWLINGYGSDATSELLLGMAEYLRVEDDAELKAMTGKLVKGILHMQQGSDDAIPGAFLSWRGVWHAYANCQTQALAVLGPMLGEEKWLAAAEDEARLFYPKLLDEGFHYAIHLDNEVKPFSQIAYGLRPVVIGLLNLYDATGNKAYAENAALAAAWFFGRNPANQRMYNPATGRCYDGINDEQTVNLNSGAESTIEALMALLEVAARPETGTVLHDYLDSL